MRYIISGLITVVGEILGDIMGFFTGSFWKELGIATKGNGLKESITQPMAGGVFDTWLPGASQVYTAFVIIGFFIATLLMIMGLLKALLPNSLADAEHPFTVVVRGILAFGAVAYAALIVCLFQQPMGELYSAIYDLGTSGNYYMAEGFSQKDASSLWSALVPGQGNSAALEGTGQLDLLETLGGGLLSIILLVAIALNFLKLILEMVERYVTTCFLFYASPLAFSTIASKSTQSVAASFIRMLFAQYLLIIFNCIFLFVFIWSYSNVMTNFGKYKITSMTMLLVFFAVMLAWLKLGQRLDEHMNTLGLGAARTGAGLMGDIVGAAYTTMAAGRALKGMAGAGAAAAGLGKNVTKAASQTDAGRKAAEAFSASPAGRAAGAVSSVGTGIKNIAAGNLPAKTMDQAINGTLRTGGAAAQSIANEKLGAVGAAMNSPQVGGGMIADQNFAFKEGPSISGGASISTIGSDGKVWSSEVGSYDDLKLSAARAAIGSGNSDVQAALSRMGFESIEPAGGGIAGLHMGIYEGSGSAMFDSEVFDKERLSGLGRLESVDVGGRACYRVSGLGDYDDAGGLEARATDAARSAFKGKI